MTALVIVMIVIQATLLWVAVEILKQLRRACELLECQRQTSVCAQASHSYPFTAQAGQIYSLANTQAGPIYTLANTQAGLIYTLANTQAARGYLYPVSPRPLGSGAFAIWCWRGTCWELESNSVPVGFQPGKSPAFQGSFVGQRVKSECTRR